MLTASRFSRSLLRQNTAVVATVRQFCSETEDSPIHFNSKPPPTPTGHKHDHLNVSKIDSSVLMIEMVQPELTVESLQWLSQVVYEIERTDPSGGTPLVRGLVLTGNGQHFITGINAKELIDPAYKRLGEFWTAVQEVYIRLYSSRLATVAAINGSCLSLGLVLATCCDARVMTGRPDALVGMPDVHLGMVNPPWVMDVVGGVCNPRDTYNMFTLGLTHSPDQALSKGLVDKLTEDDEVLAQASASVRSMLQIPDGARGLQKLYFRAGRIESMMRTRVDETEHFRSMVTHEKTQARLKQQYETLVEKRGQELPM